MNTPTSSPAHSAAPTATAVQTKVAIAACFGTFLEWYDFLTFAALASYFGALFFPPENPVAGLLASLATFGVGMVVRPLGAAIFGSLGDRIGRRRVFIATIVLMGIATFGVGLLPTYAQVGLLAPALLLALRLLQGMAMGGEIGGAVVYLTEHAPANRRGIYTSVLQLMGPLGIMASTFQVLLLQTWLSDAEFRDWGWRVPFLLSILLLAVSLKSRLALHESPVFAQLREKNGVARTPLADCFRDRHTLGRMALLFFCISAGGSLLFFSSQVYSTVFLKNVVKLDPKDAGAIVMVATLALFPLTIFCGWLSDRIGRRPVLLAGLLIGFVSLLPVFSGLLHFGNPALERFQREVRVEVRGHACGYSPFGKAVSDCEKIQELFARKGVNYTLSADAAVSIKVGGSGTAIDFNVAGFDAVAIERALIAAGWPEKADPAQIDRTMLILLLLIPVIAVAAITGPQTATLAELFPARTRYSAVALPHNLSAGWIGGLSPFFVTLLSVQAGSALAGLWYPVALLGMAAVVGLLFLPETLNARLDR